MISLVKHVAIFLLSVAGTPMNAQVASKDLKIGVAQDLENETPDISGVKWLKTVIPDVSVSNITGNTFNVNTIVLERQGTGPVNISENEGDFFVSGGKGIASFNDKTETFSFGSPTAINTPFSLSQGLTSNQLPEWTLYSLNTFEEGSSNEGLWSPREYSTCGSSSERFLGGHCKFGTNKASGIYAKLPSHSEIKVKARVHFFDQWEGQSVVLKAGDTIIWTSSWNWCPQRFSQECAKHGINSCGHSYPDRLSFPLEIAFPHWVPFLSLTFESTLPSDTDPCVVSWGVDDIAIYLR